ncbi:hypothetical protein GBAR_LOCUS28159 [Geodia barretti]|uniref:Uncharacterized protein n=1 Tax=Geodia barretti TaxID=519541 RepID=A0AA35TQT4_GEOBA|nr:hypothetical protein GBAR_LOCUS28159 [Geodia barretti]
MHFMLIKSQHSGVMSVINAEVMVMLFYVSISTRINSCLVLKIQPSRCGSSWRYCQFRLADSAWPSAQ